MTSMALAQGEALTSTPEEVDAKILRIAEMGFERARVEQAIHAAFDDPALAVEYLITGIPAAVPEFNAGVAIPTVSFTDTEGDTSTLKLDDATRFLSWHANGMCFLERIRLLEFHSSWNGSSMAAILAPEHSSLIAQLVHPAPGPARDRLLRDIVSMARSAGEVQLVGFPDVDEQGKTRTIQQLPPEADAVGEDDYAPSVGARVKLHSLQQKPEHNGAEGEVLEFDASAGRWKVQLHPNGLVLALKASNLNVMARTQQAPAPAELMCGADVEIHSCVRSPELNGVRGKVVEPQDPVSGRWGVKIDSDGRVLALKTANLVRLCGNAACRKALTPPLLQCKAAAYCSKACQVRPPPASCVDTLAMESIDWLMKKMYQLVQVEDWNGVVALISSFFGVPEYEAKGIASGVRRENPKPAQKLLNILGRGFEELGQYDKALALHAKEKAIAEEVGDRPGLLMAVGALAICHRHLGQPKQAVELNQAALTIATEVGDRTAEGAISGNLGTCLHNMREYRSAIENHERSKKIAQEVGNYKGAAISCGNIGLCYYDMGEYDRAIKQYEKRKEFAEREQDRIGLGKVSEKIGDCYLQLGQYDSVIKHHSHTKTIAMEIGDLEGVVRMCNSLGTCYEKLEQHDKGNEQRREAAEAVLARLHQPSPLQFPAELRCGADVEIHSLQQKPELNGVRGKVVEPQDPGSGRWGVKIDSDGRVLALKPANLVLIRKHVVPAAPPRPGGAPMEPSGVPDGSIPYARAAFSAQDEVADLEVVLCAPAEADTDLVNEEQLRGTLAVARRGGCSFQEKTERVERAGARGLVIVNTVDDLFTADAPGFSAGIPVVVIRAKDEAALFAAGNSSCLRPMAQAVLTKEQRHLETRERRADGGAGHAHDAGDACDARHDRRVRVGDALDQRGEALQLLQQIYAVVGGLEKLHAAADWRGIAALEREALALARFVRGVDPGLAGALPSIQIHSILGNAHHRLGDFSQAIKYHTQHLEIAKEVGDRAGEGRAYGGLGLAHHSLGGFSQAIKYHRQHLAIAKEVGDRVGESVAYGNIGNAQNRLGYFSQAIKYHTQRLEIAKEVGDRAGESMAYGGLGIAHYRLRDFSQAIKYHTQRLAIAKEVGNREVEGRANGDLGNAHSSLGDFSQAIKYHTQHLEIAKEVGDRAGEGLAGHNLGSTLQENGDLPAAARAFVQGLAALQLVERDVGAHDNRRVSLFEQQQMTYMLLQGVLLGLGQWGWALGVAAQAKARALAHRLGGGSSDAAESDAAVAKSEAYEEVCGAWWAEVQEHARGQAAAAAGSALCVLEYSLLHDARLAIWVLSGAGELLGSATVPSKGFGGTTGRTVQDLLEEARDSMKVRGREAMASSDTAQADASDSTAHLPSQRGKVCRVCLSRQCTCAADEARERALLRELYAALLAPVEEHLTGAEEVLIVPHKELFEVPWAALIDAHGHFLIEHHVLRVAPSLRVAQQAADSAAQGSARRPGHIVLVGNPLPIRSGFDSLPCAQQEAQGVHDILKRANVLVKSEHFFMSDSYPKATKANVKKSLEGAGWAHLALHGDKDTKTLVLAVPASKSDPDHAQPDLSMLEVQGSDEAADKRERVRLAEGATVVLSACNTGRGDILAEGVVGLARGFLLAGAAAAVVSLWSVDDGSTAALMEQMYRHLVEGCTVPQALRFAMLRLARRPALDQPVSEQDVADGLQEAWKRPMHWAGFLVMGASTRLPRGDI